MIGVVATEINLMPDWTIFVQLGVFLSVMAVLHIFIFKPVLKVIDHRKKFTQNAEDEAVRVSSEAERLENEKNAKISKTLEELNYERNQSVAAAQKEAEKIVVLARREAKRLLDSTEVSVEASEQSIVAEMERQMDVLAQDIVSKVMS